MKKSIILILIISIILNIVLGYNLYATKKSYKQVENENQLVLYNYCNSLSFIFKDLNDEILENEKQNQINSQYMKQSISKNVNRFVSVEKMILQLSESDAQI